AQQPPGPAPAGAAAGPGRRAGTHFRTGRARHRAAAAGRLPDRAAGRRPDPRRLPVRRPRAARRLPAAGADAARGATALPALHAGRSPPGQCRPGPAPAPHRPGDRREEPHARSAHIDFNGDLGEGCGDDAAIVPCISSASIATGGHAGDTSSMREAIALCLRHGVAIGAHPSFVDREHFGRRALALPADGVYALVRGQVGLLSALCVQAGTGLAHVKPHGALYNLATRDAAVAAAVAQAVRDSGEGLHLYALAGSQLAQAGRRLGLPVAEEVFAERAYAADGSLVPRG